MALARRRFLIAGAATGGLAAGLGGLWLGASSSPRARLMRAVLADFRRDPVPPRLRPDPASWNANRVTLAWLGHSTVLINFHGFTVLTDPVFSERIGMDLGVATAGPKRHVAPALVSQQLPFIDLVLLSHAHLDHMDLPSLQCLPEGTAAVTARDTVTVLAGTPVRRAAELGWGDRTIVRGRAGELLVEAFEVRHWGRRWPGEKERGYNGYILRREGRSLIFGGDTAFTDRFAALRSRGPFDLALMPIGAYRPWIHSHCTPEQAVAMADGAGARRIAAIHHQTFQLSDEPLDEPIARLEAALAREPGRLVFRRAGETCELA